MLDQDVHVGLVPTAVSGSKSGFGPIAGFGFVDQAEAGSCRTNAVISRT